MDKLDLRKELKHLYAPSAKQVTLVEAPEMQFVMIDGAIEPGQSPGTSPAFAAATEALYGISYTLKFASKQRADNPIDYTVMGLEGLWWVEDRGFDILDPEGWHYTAMILQPGFITMEMYEEALAKLRKKKDNPALDQLRLERFCEGPSVQILHIGPYAGEMDTIAKMDAFAEQNGYAMHGKHHEIYLGDPRRADPMKLKTVLRHPVRKMV